MTPSSPHMHLNRLIVVAHNSKIVYDEIYHKGVNIIRGRNSSGKSTIANFIFFIFGGDFHSWTTEAHKCRDIFAEVEINGAVITLKRQIAEGGLQPMNLYWGTYENAKQDSINWQTYPYKQTDNYVSFTNVLFNTLNFPEVKSDADSNITMHQILRLMYIDQDTPTQNLFRFERFDLPLTRQAISEVLLGIYDDFLYYQRLQLRSAKKDEEEKKKQFEGISRIFGKSGSATTIGALQKEIDTAKAELAKIEADILELRQKQKVNTTKKTALETENIQQQLIPIKNDIQGTKSKINQFEIEIFDSRQFISTLEKRVMELTNSLHTRNVLGELPLTHCPQCLSPLENHVGRNVCVLCKQPLAEEAEKANAQRMLQEMMLQIKESKTILDNKEKRLIELTGSLPVLTEKARMLQKQLDISVNVAQTTRDERLDLLLVEKGGADKQVEYLAEQIKAVEQLELLKTELAELAALIKTLNIEIAEKEQQQQEKHRIAMRKIKEYTLSILRADLDRQEEFKTGKIVDINFQKDTYALDGSNNFSASSKIYFKNAVLFSIFFAAVELDFFRYPRFILCDNMEDKGMEKERTQNFQRVITAISEKINKEHQIIFTTSMIADELNNTAYCVGDEYSETNKTLKF